MDDFFYNKQFSLFNKISYYKIIKISHKNLTNK